MLKENKIVELNDKDLKQVSGGDDIALSNAGDTIIADYEKILDMSANLPDEIFFDPLLRQFNTTTSYAIDAFIKNLIPSVEQHNKNAAGYLDTLKQQYPESCSVFEKMEQKLNEINDILKSL